MEIVEKFFISLQWLPFNFSAAHLESSCDKPTKNFPGKFPKNFSSMPSKFKKLNFISPKKLHLLNTCVWHVECTSENPTGYFWPQVFTLAERFTLKIWSRWKKNILISSPSKTCFSSNCWPGYTGSSLDNQAGIFWPKVEKSCHQGLKTTKS